MDITLLNKAYDRLAALNRDTAMSRFDRAGNKILCKLTRQEFIDIWVSSGHLHERGSKKGQYVLSRKDDLGHYEVGNVFVQLGADNIREGKREQGATNISKAKKGVPQAQWVKEQTSARMSRPCTIDGVVIYPSVRHLIKALGQGKLGYKHPSFRFVD